MVKEPDDKVMLGPRDAAEKQVLVIAIFSLVFLVFVIIAVIHYRQGRFPVSGGYAYLSSEPRRFYIALSITAGVALFALARAVWAAITLRRLHSATENQGQ